MTLLRYTPPFVLWVVAGAILTSYYGALSILNPFRHLLSMVEAMEFLVQWLLGSGMPYQLFPITTPQALNAIAGLFGLAGWFLLMVVIFARYGVADI